MRRLTETFLIELLASTLKSTDVMRLCVTYLEYEYFKDDAYKIVWKTIKNEFTEKNRLPNLGTIAQKLDTPLYSKKRKEEIEIVIKDIQNITPPSATDLIITLEEFLKDSMSVKFYDQFAEHYNKGEKELAIQLLLDSGEELSRFSLVTNSDMFIDILGDYQSRIVDRILDKGKYKSNKCKWGIDPLDRASFGGVDKGDTALVLGASGQGKSKVLKHIGVNNVRDGKLVLHIQGEGTEQECIDLYDATIAGLTLAKVEKGDVERPRLDKIKGFANYTLNNGGKLLIYTVKELGGFTMYDIEGLILEVYKNFGRFPDVLIMDYFELFEPGDKRYGVGDERHRRDKLGIMMKNIAVKYNLALFTATQATTVAPEKSNDPDFIMTRHNASEFKNVTKPFSYFITMNQTDDEYAFGEMRLYLDKWRKYKGRHIFHILQAYETERFFDRNNSIDRFEEQWNEQFKKQEKTAA